MPIEFAGALLPAIVGLVAGTIILRNRRSQESPVVWAIGVLAVVFGAVFGCYMFVILLMNIEQFF